MKRKRYTEEKIIAILKEHEAGASVSTLSRRYAVAENTIYRWTAKFGGILTLLTPSLSSPSS